MWNSGLRNLNTFLWHSVFSAVCGTSCGIKAAVTTDPFLHMLASPGLSRESPLFSLFNTITGHKSNWFLLSSLTLYVHIHMIYAWHNGRDLAIHVERYIIRTCGHWESPDYHDDCLVTVAYTIASVWDSNGRQIFYTGKCSHSLDREQEKWQRSVQVHSSTGG